MEGVAKVTLTLQTTDERGHRTTMRELDNVPLHPVSIKGAAAALGEMICWQDEKLMQDVIDNGRPK